MKSMWLSGKHRSEQNDENRKMEIRKLKEVLWME